MLLIALAIAAGLAGPPDPPQYTTQQIVSVADGIAADSLKLGLGWALDTGSTGIALDRCPTCYESNPAGINVETRMSLKLAGNLTALGACYVLRRTGHSRAASVLSWLGLGLQAAASANNLRLAARGH
jgi:hypothetical protein